MLLKFLNRQDIIFICKKFCKYSSENESNQYKDISKQREVNDPQYRELIPPMAKEPGLEMRGQESGEILKIPWEEVIHKHVRTSDNVDIGDVDKVGNEFIVVREGVGGAI